MRFTPFSREHSSIACPLVIRPLFLLLALRTFAAVLPGSAQEVTGTILGTVTDPSGAVIRNANVVLTNSDRNLVARTANTGNGGEFTAPQLPIGNYSISVEAPGFKKFEESKITLNVNDQRTVKVILSVGSSAETVNVEANQLQVDTQSSTPQGLITGTQIRELALQSRNYEELVALMPGVSANLGDALYAGVSAPNGNTNETAFSINGSFGSQNNWSVDGADNVDRGGNFSLLNYPSVDAIDEFKVLRGNYNAEYGRSAGGQINVITRSGTTHFHGGIYEFFRNDVLNANDWGNKQQSPVAARTPFRYNDFGGTFGGPLFIPRVYNTARNKTFFFYSEELRRVVQSNPVTGISPNALERTGTFANPVCNAAPNADGSCPGQMITTVANINQAAAGYLKDVYSHVPLPQDPASDNLFSNSRNQFNFRQEIVRVDHTFGPALSGFVRYMSDSIPTIEGGGLFNGNPLPNISQTTTKSPGRNVVGNLSMTFSPTFLNELEYAWSYGAILSTNTGQLLATNSPDVVSAIQLPFPETLDRIPSLSFGTSGASFFGFGSYKDYNKNHTAFDNVTKVLGAHSLKAGFSYNHYVKSENAGGNNAGTFTFQASVPQQGPGVQTEFQQEFALFLLGQSTQFTQTAVDIRALVHQNQLEFYAQDEYHARPNLTLSYGVRYSLFRQPTDAKNHITTFDPSRYVAANAPVIDQNGNLCIPATQPCAGTQSTNPSFDPLNGIIIGGKGNGSHDSPYGTAIARQTYNGLQPRIGFALDPAGNGKTSIRGGYGVFFESPGVGFVENNVFINPPFVGATTIGGAPFDNPNGGAASNNSVQNLGGTDVKWHQPYTQQWDLDLQHELPYNVVVDIGYYGAKSTHQLSQVDINQPSPGDYATNPLIQQNPGFTPGQQLNGNSEGLLNLIRPYQGYGPIDIYQPRFSSNYNSFQVSAQKHIGASSLVGIAYTYAKSLTNRPDEPGGNLPLPQSSANIDAEYGPSRFDRRHVFNGNYVYNLPFFIQQRGLAGHVLGGWEVSGIISLQSGLWLSAMGTAGTDPGGVGVLTQATAPPFNRPDQVGNPQSHAPHTVAQWYNVAAFADVPATEFRPGNARRATILGPGSERWDMSLLKNIKVYESAQFQFRLEAFNLLNHTNFTSVDTQLNDGTTGQVRNSAEKRIVQLALKFNF